MATHLTDEEIQGILFPLESEASSDEEDENVPDFEAEEIVDDCESKDSTPDIPSTTATLSKSTGQAVKWTKPCLNLPPEKTTFRGTTTLPPSIQSMESPFQFLSSFSPMN